MFGKNSTKVIDNSTFLTLDEERDIEKKVDYEIVKSHYNMIKIGGLTNILSGIFVIWILYGHTPTLLLLGWYAVLVGASAIDIGWAKLYEKDINNAEKLKTWRYVFCFIFAGLCLTWGSMGILFITPDIHYQLYTIAFLLAALIGFIFSAVTDFTLAIICLLGMLLPTIIYRVYLGLHNILLYGNDPDLNFGFSISLFILGLFLLIVSYIGARIVKKFFMLSFANVALSHKLENMNKFLEQRVKERTIELEKSLNLVTYQATHDLLTDLPNQRLLLEYLQESIESAKYGNSMFGVMFFSLNEIEKINDGLGHQAGDLVIKTVAQRLQNKCEINKNIEGSKIHFKPTLTRKDVFVILVEPIYKLDEMEKLTLLFFSILEEPIYTEKQVVKLTASIGVSIYPRNGKNINTLLMNADAAMLSAKQVGGNSLNVYKSEINADISKQLEMEIKLHDAVKNSEFILQYQPFISLKTGEICGAEALVRWESPTLGFVSPADFIPLAEANGLIVPLGDWVFRMACEQTKKWHSMGFKSLKVAINLSAKQLQQKNIVQTIATIVKQTNIDPKFIEIELTETTAFQSEVIPILKQCKAMGFDLSIDDFGTGYSGLTNLKLFEINKLKIDKSFIDDLVTNEDSRAIVANTITLAKKLNITILAEGVETKEQINFLRENGCDMIQGYYFSRPINPDVFTSLLESKKLFVIE